MATETNTLPPAWHAMTAPEALARLNAVESGLTQEEAARRLAVHGPNRLPEAKRRSAAMRFLLQFHNVLIYVLLASAVITAALGHAIDTAVILAVVLVNAVIGHIQEGKAERAMESIRRMLAPHAAVLRGGVRSTVSGEELVPGDIVLLEAGDKVPADLRIVQAHGLRIEEAILTGESVPSGKSDAPAPEAALLGDRASMAFSGTLVAAGAGKGLVVATGTNAEIGKISGLVAAVETLETPLTRQMDAFARWLTILILLLAALLLLFGYVVEHHDFAGMFMAVVGLSVAAIPEGLPAVLTITLAIGVQAMARRNAIVRRLPAIETLGSVSVVCTDKTGTLTRNEMMAASAVMRGGRYEIEGEGYKPEGAIRCADSSSAQMGHAHLEELALAAILCNDAQLRAGAENWCVEGDPMEGALLAFAGKLGLLQETARAWPRVAAIPFDAQHRYMAVLNRGPSGEMRISVKGAPERVVAMCSAQRGPGGARERLDTAFWLQQAEEIAAQGQRVLAFATKEAPAVNVGRLEAGDIEGDLTFVGLIGLIDPPRPEAIAAVAECRGAGIRVKMITGDHAGTAVAIARQIGLESPEVVLTGADLDAMDDGELSAAVIETDVFARTSPQHKLRLVVALQAHGLTVAMTGDGVNDAPALKRADAGVAMGLKGSEAAKEASDLVLADDNFASIAAAVREGRTVYDNIKKVISWTLPTNAGEAAVVVAALLSGLALPVSPIQILWINLVTATTLGIALAFEPTEDGTMRRPPRPRAEPILSGHLIWHVTLVSLLFLAGTYGIYAYALDRGYTGELARTLAMNTIVIMEIFHLFFIRNIYGASLTWKAVRGTKPVWIAVLSVTAAQFAVTYAPPLQGIFETRDVAIADGLIILGIGIALFAIIEIEKQLRLTLVRA